MRNNALMTLASALTKCAKLTEAKAAAQAIEDEGCKAGALRELAVAVAAAGQETADVIFEQVVQQLKAVPQYWRQHPMSQNLVVAFVCAGRYMKALEFLQPYELDEYLNLVIECIRYIERSNPQASIGLLREVSEVAGWARPRWRQIHVLLLDHGAVCGLQGKLSPNVGGKQNGNLLRETLSATGD